MTYRPIESGLIARGGPGGAKPLDRDPAPMASEARPGYARLSPAGPGTSLYRRGGNQQ